MATTQSNKLEIDQLRSDLDLLMSKSVQPKDGDSTAVLNTGALVPVQNPGENVKFITALEFLFLMLKQIGMVDINSTGDKAGAHVFGIKAGVNEGNLLIGAKVKAGVSEPTSDTDFDYLGYTQ